jgi:hypothetical protein
MATELNAANSLRIISDEDLGAVAGGKQVYEGGGGGTMARGGYQQPSPGPILVGWGNLVLLTLALTL